MDGGSARGERETSCESGSDTEVLAVRLADRGRVFGEVLRQCHAHNGKEIAGVMYCELRADWL